MSLIEDFDEAEYHRLPSLSSSGAKMLIKDTPALYKHVVLDGNRVDKPSFDFGHIVHGMVLGVGDPVVAIPAKLLASNGAASTGPAKAFIADMRAEGKIPVKGDVVKRARLAAEAVFRHKDARELMERDGVSEVSAFAHDEDYGIDLRCRFDRFSKPWGIDLKTGIDASPRGFNKAVAEYRYDIQDAFYRDVYRRATGETLEEFFFVAVEVEPPFGVATYQLDSDYLRMGREAVVAAKRIYQACMAADSWPSYSQTTQPLHPPMWLAIEHDERFGNG